jgi:hypothetical protein
VNFHSRTGWTAIPNKLFEDKDISSDGVRLISWLISHQKGKFKVSRAAMAKALGLGEHRLRKAIKVAKGAGYLKTVSERCTKTGQIKNRFDVSTDGRFSASGKPTCIITPNRTTEREALFLSAFPASPNRIELFRSRLDEVLGKFAWEYVIGEAERYNLEILSRVKGGRIALPENWLWRLLYPNAGEVIESDCEKESENNEIVSKYAA